MKPIVFHDRSMAQLVIDPGSDDSYQMAAAIAGIAWKEHLQYPLGVVLRARLLKVLHPYVHHFVVWKTFDVTSQRLVDTGMVCAYCGLGELR